MAAGMEPHPAGERAAPVAPPRSAFVGRAEELAELRQAVDALSATHGSLFLLTGEPGIGKTRVCEEIGRLAAGSGTRVIWGRCHEADGRPPYWPWAQAIRSCARHVDPAELAATLVPDALPLAEIIPELRLHVKDLGACGRTVDPETARFRLFQALTVLLRRVAAVQPLLLILDDLHWADLPSLRMLEFLAHELPDVPILVVATLREVEVRRAPAVAEIVDRLGRLGRRLSLAGFRVDEVLRFVEAAAGQPVPEAVAHRLHRDTEGNPFFLDEIVRQFRGAGGWSASSPIPLSHGVRSAIRQRLAPLPEATRRLLSAAAVAGREFDLALMEAGVSTPRSVLLEQLAPAIDVEVVRRVPDRAGRYRFSHALIRETIYEQVRPSDGVALHRRFGSILEERHQSALDAYLPELAHHFFAAAAGGAEAKALDYVERAGRQALRVLAYEEAAEHFQRALHLVEMSPVGDPARECELLLGLAEAKNRAGQGDESLKACHRAAALARRIGSSALLARAAIGLCDVGVAWAEFGRYDDTLVRTLEEALERLDPGDATLRAPVMARIATEQFWTRPLEEIDSLSRQAVALARRAGDDRSLAYALMARIHCLSDPDSFSQRRELIDEVIALSGGHGKLAINAYLWRFGDELQFGDRASAHASGETLIRAVEDLRQPRDLWLVPAVRSRNALLLGRFEDAERLAERVIEDAAGVRNAEQAYLALLFMIRREQGRHREMLDGLAAIAGQSLVAVWHAPLALLYAEHGETESALAELDGLMRNGMQALRRDLTWLFSVASLAAACNACDSRVHAPLLYDALLPYDGHTVAEGVFCYFGPVSYYLGLLATTRGDPAAAMRHLDDALAAARADGARPFVARILLAQAQAVEAGRPADPSRARALRRQAAELGDSMGMRGVAAAARQGLEGATDGAAPERVRARLRCEGDFWVVGYQGRSAQMKAIKGFLYLARLLESPGEEFHVLDLAQRTVPRDAPSARTVVADGVGPILDARAKNEIRRRLAELREELEEAEANNDGFRASTVRAEIRSIGDAVAGSVGLGGRDRTQGSQAERARAAVTKALRATIERIEQFDPSLADVLSRTVRTGVFCSYVPLAGLPIDWEVVAPTHLGDV
jgi:tetratricopeptide (TPR) repeat protein